MCAVSLFGFFLHSPNQFSYSVYSPALKQLKEILCIGVISVHIVNIRMWMSSAWIFVAARFKNDFKFNENNFFKSFKKDLWNLMRTIFSMHIYTSVKRREKKRKTEGKILNIECF